jgi:hypothetical protein
MDKQQLYSWIGYLKGELYKPALRPYVTAIMGVADALEVLLQEGYPPVEPFLGQRSPTGGAPPSDSVDKKYKNDRRVDASTRSSRRHIVDTVDADRLQTERPVDPEQRRKALRALRQARWRAKQKEERP